MGGCDVHCDEYRWQRPAAAEQRLTGQCDLLRGV